MMCSDFGQDNEVVRTDMLDYAFEIEYFDSHLERNAKNSRRPGNARQ